MFYYTDSFSRSLSLSCSLCGRARTFLKVTLLPDEFAFFEEDNLPKVAASRTFVRSIGLNILNGAIAFDCTKNRTELLTISLEKRTLCGN